jgi:hypothetical protein
MVNIQVESGSRGILKLDMNATAAQFGVAQMEP